MALIEQSKLPLAVDIVGVVERAAAHAGLKPDDWAVCVSNRCRCGCGTREVGLLAANGVRHDFRPVVLADVEAGVRVWLDAVSRAAMPFAPRTPGRPVKAN